MLSIIDIMPPCLVKMLLSRGVLTYKKYEDYPEIPIHKCSTEQDGIYTVDFTMVDTKNSYTIFITRCMDCNKLLYKSPPFRIT